MAVTAAKLSSAMVIKVVTGMDAKNNQKPYGPYIGKEHLHKLRWKS